MSTGQTAYYFGAFDPIHEGHLTLAQAAYEQFGFARIVFVLAYCPPNKLPERHSHSLPANFEVRAHQAQKVLSAYPFCELSLIESDLAVPTYTIDTLRALVPNFETRHQDIPFLMGADSFETIQSWKAAEELATRLWFCVAPRFGASADTVPMMLDDKTPLRVDLIHMAPVDVSSTALRAFIT